MGQDVGWARTARAENKHEFPTIFEGLVDLDVRGVDQDVCMVCKHFMRARVSPQTSPTHNEEEDVKMSHALHGIGGYSGELVS